MAEQSAPLLTLWQEQMVAADGSEVAYDRLLMATGSNPFILPVPGNDLAGRSVSAHSIDRDAQWCAQRSQLTSITWRPRYVPQLPQTM